MALVKAEKENKFNWNVRETTNVRSKLPKITKTPTIDYDKLSWLCNIQGMKTRDQTQSTEEAHQVFMENYRSMFVPEPAKIGFPVHSEKRAGNPTASSTSYSHKAASTSTSLPKISRRTLALDEYTHNIKDYLPLLHKERKSEDPLAIRADNIKTLRRILKKLPFERTAGENDKIFSILQTFSFFKENVDSSVLKELCVVAQVEAWKEADFAVYGKTGVHMILRGTAVPCSQPYLVCGKDGRFPKTFISLDPLHMSADDIPELTIGDCFGSWLPYDQPYTSELSVMTAEENCEFLKISASDYKRVIEQIKQREHTEKLNLLLSCDQYRMWPKQPLLSVAGCIEWISYPPNTVLVSEGYKSPFLGFIKSGECHVLRQVEVLQQQNNGKKEQKTKQVVMGKLRAFDSFAEISLLMEENITCSIVTATDVQLGIVRPDKLKDLDEVTKQLFRQSNIRTYGDLTKEDIQNEYLQQELKREWNEFKHAQVLEVINSQGIRPGYGKWAK